MKPRAVAFHIANRRAHGGVKDTGSAVLSRFSMAKRAIPFAPGFSIDNNGGVWCRGGTGGGIGGGERLPTTTMRSAKGVECLAVCFTKETEAVVSDGSAQPVMVWRILSQVWYSNKVILPRDGNALNWKMANVIVLGSITNTEAVPAISDIDEILKIWVTYLKDGIGCWQLAEKTGFFYSRDQFWSLIRDVLVAGIK